MSGRIGRLLTCVLGLAMGTAACDNGLTNAFSRSGRGFGTTGGSGTVQGSVTTATGGLGGVGVVLVGRDSTQTDGSGSFTFTSVPAGTYTVTVRVPTGFALAAGQTGTQSVTVSTGGTATATFTVQQTTTTP